MATEEASRGIFARPHYMSEAHYTVIQRVALQVVLSVDSARFQMKLLEKTRHLSTFNFLRDPSTDSDVIRANTLDSVSPLTMAQSAEVHRLYKTFLTSYAHNREHLRRMQPAVAQGAQGGGDGAFVYTAGEPSGSYHQQQQHHQQEYSAAPAQSAGRLETGGSGLFETRAAAVNSVGPSPAAGVTNEPVALAPHVSRIAANSSAGCKRSRTPTDDDDE